MKKNHELRDTIKTLRKIRICENKFYIIPTNKCYANCYFCNKCDKVSDKNYTDMRKDSNYLLAVELVAKHRLDIREVVISGYEPLLCDIIDEITKNIYSYKNRFDRITLDTNVLGISMLEKSLKQHVTHINYNIPHYDKDIIDTIYNINNDSLIEDFYKFSKVYFGDIIKSAISGGKTISITCRLNKYFTTVGDLELMINFCVQNGVNDVIFICDDDNKYLCDDFSSNYFNIRHVENNLFYIKSFLIGDVNITIKYKKSYDKNAKDLVFIYDGWLRLKPLMDI